MFDRDAINPRAAMRVPPPETYEAVIADDVTAPGEDAFVVIPAFSNRHVHGPCVWMPYNDPSGFYYPKRGDRAAVVVPAGGDPWIVTWKPEATEPDDEYETT